MNKLWLIIQREYLTRVKKRSFILTTLLTPIGFALFIVAVVFIMSAGNDKQSIVVKDDTHLLKAIPGKKTLSFTFSEEPLDTLIKHYKDKNYDGLLYLSAADNKNWNNTLYVDYYSEDELGIVTRSYMEDMIAEKIKDAKVDSSHYDRRILKNFETTVQVRAKSDKDHRKLGDSAIATGMGTAMGFMIYIVLFIYGTMVMRAVMEEKTSRIVEVIISSVKPFQLMLGKIIGVGMVGLTQFLIWLILIPLIQLGIGLMFSSRLGAMQDVATQQAPGAERMAALNELMSSLGDYNYFYLIGMFLIFFLGGYILYATLFAAVGSAMGDDMSEGQSLTLPITIPVILSIYIAMAVVQNPNSSLATWSSMIPFFSPVVMTARLPFNPPVWEIVMSVTILIGSCIFFVWLSGRIYRVGILMYGKKVTLRELGKWLFMKD